MVSAELLKIVKTHLRVAHSQLDSEIEETIKEGMAVIEAMCGSTDFNESLLGRKLLKNYCRYEWNGVGNAFESNFRSDILRLQMANGNKRKGERNAKKATI